jgi:hypothetical protein
MTSSIADILKSATAIDRRAMVSPQSHAQQLAPLPAKMKLWSGAAYYGLCVVMLEGWRVQFPSFAGDDAAMAYLPSQKIAIAVSVTLLEDASVAKNRSIEITKELTAYLAPQAPLDERGMR